MVDAKVTPKLADDPRASRRAARKRRLQLIAGGRSATIKVFAANGTIREVLRHPSGRIRFRDSIEEGVEWPNDSFTQRRIADGSVRTDGPGSSDYAPEPDPSLNAREQAAARLKTAKNGQSKPYSESPPETAA